MLSSSSYLQQRGVDISLFVKESTHTEPGTGLRGLDMKRLISTFLNASKVHKTDISRFLIMFNQAYRYCRCGL
jgi:hypothetical protein